MNTTVKVSHANISPDHLDEIKGRFEVSESYDQESGSWYAEWVMPLQDAKHYARQFAPSVKLFEII